MKSMKSNWLRVWAVIPGTWPLWTCSLQRTVEDLEAVRDRPAARSCAPRSELLVEEGRRMAAELGVDAEALDGTGPHGSVVRADVEEAAGAESATGRSALSSASRSPAGSCPRRCGAAAWSRTL